MLLHGGAVLAFPGNAKNTSWAETQVWNVWQYPSRPKMSPCCSSHHEEGGSSHTPPHSSWHLPPPPGPLPYSPFSSSLRLKPGVHRALQDLLTLTFININTFAEDVIMKTICRSKMRRKAVRISYQ